jgi:hypothetical protein
MPRKRPVVEMIEPSPRTAEMKVFIAAPKSWWTDERLVAAIALESKEQRWLNGGLCNRVSDREFGASCSLHVRLQLAIIRAPARGLIGARVKLTALMQEHGGEFFPWDRRSGIRSALKAIDRIIEAACVTELREAA